MQPGIASEVDTTLREARRREMMAVSDALLEEVEQLFLRELDEVPETLAGAIADLERRLERTRRQHRGLTRRAAHRLLFAVQQRLMAANPAHPAPARHFGRAAGTASFRVLSPTTRWKFLTLPPTPVDDEGWKAWRLAAELTVERAFDRWACAQEQAKRACSRQPSDPGQLQAGLAAVGSARAAWRNYFELAEEAARLGAGRRD